VWGFGWVLVLVLALAVGSPSSGGAAPGAAVVVADVVVDGTDGRLRQLTVRSPALGRDAGVRVLLPTGFDDPGNAGRRWPILWLLHGVGDDHRTWTTNADVVRLTAGLPLVVAMPEGGRNVDAGWYSDWVAGPRWETFHLTELLPLVEQRFGVGGARERRVIAGLSMGGFGAMSYAARHPDLWVAAASFSGAVHPTMLGPVGALAFELLAPYVGTPGDPIWGPYETSEVVWQGHDPVELAPNLRTLGGLHLRSGNGVPCAGDNVQSAPLEVGVYPMNLVLHERLGGLGIGHDWFDRGCGTHEWHHWEADLAAVLPPFLGVLASPPAAPERFDHRFVDDRLDLFGWRFEVSARAAPAFTSLAGASATGLTATGSGTLTVTTPARHPGRWEVSTPAGISTVDADADGRLTFSMALSTTPAEVRLTELADPAAVAADGAAAPAPEDDTRLPTTGATMPTLAAVVLVAVALLAGAFRARADARPRRAT
jgi:S-formylglutathione hydrolase FrmB